MKKSGKLFLIFALLSILLISSCTSNQRVKSDGGSVEEETEKEHVEELNSATTCEDKIKVLNDEMKLSKNELEGVNKELRNLAFELQQLKVGGDEEEKKEKQDRLRELADQREELEFKIEFLENEVNSTKC